MAGAGGGGGSWWLAGQQRGAAGDGVRWCGANMFAKSLRSSTWQTGFFIFEKKKFCIVCRVLVMWYRQIFKKK